MATGLLLALTLASNLACSLVVEPKLFGDAAANDAPPGNDGGLDSCSSAVFVHLSTDGLSRYRTGRNRSWDEAQAECDGLGGYLAVVGSDQERVDLQNIIVTSGMQMGADFPNASIGASDSVEEGSFTWIVAGAEPAPGTGGVEWVEGQPNGGNAQDCVALVRDADAQALTDIHCDHKRFFICECDGRRASADRFCETRTDESCTECGVGCASTLVCDPVNGACGPPPPPG